MADTVERTIYKLELDDSGYIKGVDGLTASTKKLTDQQEAANKRLTENEKVLKESAATIEKNKKALESYTGSDKKQRDQLEANLKASQASHAKLSELVDNVRRAYEKAKKAADDFNNTSARATNLQQQTTGGKIPIAPPPGIVSPISIQNFDLGGALSNNKKDFDALADSISKSEEQLSHLGESKAFTELSHIVEHGKEALHKYNEVVNLTSESHVSLRTQIRLGKEELVKLEEQGKETSQQYFELEKRVAKLTDAFNDQQQRIKILASDTKLLDFGKGAITAATSAFQTYASVSILSGTHNDELQKKTLQLFAAMQLLQSLEQLSNLTRREGVLATLSQSAAQAVYTSVVGASTGALKAFRIALLGSGIIGAVAAIGFLVQKYLEFKRASEEAGKQQKLFKEINEEAAKSVGTEVAKLEVFRTKLNDLSISQKERVSLAKEYNKISDDQNKIDVKQIDNLILINEQIDKQTKLIIARAVSLAATAKIGEQASKFIDLQLKVSQSAKELGFSDEELLKQDLDFLIKLREGAGAAGRNLELVDSSIKKTFGSVRKAIGLRDLINEKKAAEKELKDLGDLLAPLITPEGLSTKGDEEKGKGGKEIENVFIKTLRELLARLRAASKEEIQSVDLIQQDFTDKLFSEIDKIDDLVSKKQLTAKQGNILTKILEKVIGKEADKSIADFKKKVQTAINKLQDELNDIQNKANIDSLNLLQDEFDRRAKLIEANEKIELDNSKQATQDRLDSLELDRLLIGEKNYQDAKAVIIQTGEQNANNIVAKFGAARQELAADIFKKSLDAFEQGLNTGLVFRDEEVAKQIRAASNKFLQGKISFEQFEKDITKIQKDEESIRRDITLDNQRSELAALDRQIKAIKDKTTQQYKDLIKLREQLASTIAANEKEDAIKDATEDPNKRKKDSLADYVDATAQLADAVIAFWQKANEAETKALDYSISLQEKRVDAAQRIAARGNAEYLKQEEDRLTELNVKREAAARKQLGIDAALQASQVLVGITGAISKIASSPFGAETIAEIAVIIGALATGYGIVKSLQGNQPKLAKGDPYVKRNGHPAGIDTIPAWLNEGEAVTSAEKNKAYHPVIRAIHEGKIPADQLNQFVNTYHKVKGVPQVDYGRIKDVSELHINQDGKLAGILQDQNRKIDENNDLQRQTLRALKSMGVNVNMDKNGIAVSVMEAVDQITKDKKI